MAFGNIYHFFHRSSQAIHKFYQHVFINITKQLIICRNDIIIYTVKNAIHKIYQMIPASCKCIDKINAPMNLFLTVLTNLYFSISILKCFWCIFKYWILVLFKWKLVIQYFPPSWKHLYLFFHHNNTKISVWWPLGKHFRVIFLTV